MLSEEDIKEAKLICEQYPSLWVEWNGIKNEAGIPIELDGDHFFLRDIYDDLSPLQVLLKPPQIGATIMNTLKSFYIAKMKGKQIIYTLPTQRDVSDMVGGSINRVIAQNPILMEWVKDHDTVEQKTVGNSIIFYRGTFTAKQAMMIPSDLNIHDEVDVSDATVITQYETRLQAKADGMRWYFSHPSLSGHGVDIYWNLSDKKEWFITCPHCEEEQILSWPQNIDIVRSLYICCKCKGTLENHDRRNGKWKATSSGAFSGYHCSQLMCPWISATKILEVKNDPMKYEQYFYNYVLGLPYIESDDKINPSVILKNVTSKINSQVQPIVIGVDPGLPIWFVCMNKEGVFYNGSCSPKDPWNDIERMLIKWPQAIAVIDQGGDFGSRVLMQKYPGRVFIVYYRKDRKSEEMVKWMDDGSIVVDRNKMITLMVQQLRDVGRINLNGTEEEWKVFASHFGNIMRTKKETPFGMEYEWIRNGPDHFVHALLYAMVGFDRFGMQEASIVSSTDWLDDVPRASRFEL